MANFSEKTEMDLVSIITPTWNCEKYIAETVSCVLAQTYTHWELIIVDDCSHDRTREIIYPYMKKDSRIRYVRNEKNIGAALTRNYALRLAKGRWIAFLDSDDLWHPFKLEKQIKFMEDNEYSFSYTNYCEVDESTRAIGTYVSGPKHISKLSMYNYCWPGCLTVMYDVRKVGLIQIPDIKKNNDYAMWLRVVKKTDCHLLNENLAKYRIRSGSISNHGYVELIKWHYRLFHEAEGMGLLLASVNVVRNLFFGVIKKVFYTKRKYR